MNTRIYAAEKSFDIGCRVVKWDESKGLNFTPLGKFTKRNLSFDKLSPLVKQFTIHWSVTYRGIDTFTGLNARGLSCNFIIGDDDVNGYASIFQTLDIVNAGWSQGQGLNDLGPGVEISYMPDAYTKDRYTLLDRQRWGVPKHETVLATVHGAKLKVHIPTKAQIASLVQLMWGFSELFPNVPAKFPRTPQGFPTLTKLNNPREYSGFVSHYHLRREKIDTAGLDMEMLEQEVEARKKFGY